MQAIRTNAPGGWDHTQLMDVEEPVRGSGEVLVEIHAVGLNPADYFVVEGKYPGGPKPPYTIGRDAAGVVLESENETFAKGTPVVVLASEATDLVRGTLAERQVFSSDRLATLPEGWSMEEGAAAPLAYLTAWQALMDDGNLQEGQAVAVTGASGGVGSAAVQLAVGRGATVVALSRSAAKQQRLREMGAHHVFDPRDAELKHKVSAALGRAGVDLVIENVGGDSLDMSMHLLDKDGCICVVGLLAGIESKLSLPALIFKRAMVRGCLVHDFTTQHATVAWRGVTETLAESGQRPLIDSRFPMEEFGKAFERLRESPMGKVIVTIK